MTGRTIGASARPFSGGPDAPAWPWPDPVDSMGCAWEVCRGPWLGPEEIARMARRRWQALVAYARRHSPFYAQLYVHVAQPVVEQIETLPVVTKQMLMADFDRVVTRPELRLGALAPFLADLQQVGAPFAGSYAVWTSSGTSGVPAVFLHDAHALALYDALQLFRFRGAHAGFDGRPLPSAFGRYAMVAATGGHFAGAASVERLRRLYPWMASSLRTISLMQPLADLVAQLNEYQPQIVATYPTVAVLLAQEQQAGRLRIAPQQIWTGGECLSEATRQSVQRALGAPVREEYGASEFPSIGVGCRAGWLHVNADWVLLEPVDAQRKPVPPGVTSENTLLTNLANHAQPLIRYELGDAVTVRPDPCPCGNRLPALRVQGRCDDVLRMAGEGGQTVSLLPLVLTTVLEEGADLYEFQLLQDGPRALRLRVGALEPNRAAAACAALRRFLGQQGLAAVAVELSLETPQRGALGGKLQRIRASAAAPAC
jgi:phenylacetate-coenzyme A ligase PaaK-like adenylate-forming protein